MKGEEEPEQSLTKIQERGETSKERISEGKFIFIARKIGVKPRQIIDVLFVLCMY